MKDIDTVLELVRQNEEIARKFHEIEIKILSILNFTDFFEVLLTEIKSKFQVPYVWMTLINSGEVPDLIEKLSDSEMLKTRVRILEEDIFMALVPSNGRPLLINKDLEQFYALLPQNKNYFIKSMAMVPITLDGALIGSLNQGDFSRTRFAPDIDPSLLERLGLKVSLCLANVTAHEKLEFLAYHDPLTGLLNRRVMESILKREYLRANRYVSPLSVIFMDLDNFKKVNDRLGHDVGDQLLQHTASALQQMVRSSDIVARFAGDEFVVILPETIPDKACRLMARIRSYFLEYPVVAGNEGIPIGISYGVSSTDDDGVTGPDSLLRLADQRLYEMKAQKPS